MLIIVSKRVPYAVFCYRAQDEAVGWVCCFSLWVNDQLTAVSMNHKNDVMPES